MTFGADSTDGTQKIGPVSQIPCDLLLLSGSDNHFAWFGNDTRFQRLLIRVDLNTGKSATLDLTSLGTEIHPTRISRIPNKNALLAFTGLPPRFVEIDPEKMILSEVSQPVGKKDVWWGADAYTIDDQGTMYVGLYPAARLVSYHPATGKYRDYGSISGDKAQGYLRPPAVTKDGTVVYCAVGLLRSELWAVDPQTGAKRQIFPPELILKGGKTNLWQGRDGQVYGNVVRDKTTIASYACFKDHVEVRPTVPPPAESTERFQGNRISTLTADGEVRGGNGNKPFVLKTDFPGVGGMIFSLPMVVDNQLFGSTWLPSELFNLDLATGQVTNFGRRSAGRIETYSMIPYKKGIILGSYTGCEIDYLDSLSPSAQRIHLASLDKNTWEQERPFQMAQGADGAVYVASLPIKGQLGGALTRIDPEKKTIDVHRNIIPNQSILSVVPVPDTSLLFCTSGIRGGTSAIPTEKEGCLFLWDTVTQKIVYQATPLPGASDYLRALPVGDGEVFCLGDDGRFVLWNVADRKVSRSGKIDGGGKFKFPFVNPITVGKNRDVVVYGDQAVFLINRTTSAVRSIFQFSKPKNTMGFYVTDGGILYFGVDTTLYRKNLLLPSR